MLAEYFPNFYEIQFVVKQIRAMPEIPFPDWRRRNIRVELIAEEIGRASAEKRSLETEFLLFFSRQEAYAGRLQISLRDFPSFRDGGNAK